MHNRRVMKNSKQIQMRYGHQIRDILRLYPGAFDTDTIWSCVWGIVAYAYLENTFPTMLPFIPTILNEVIKYGS